MRLMRRKAEAPIARAPPRLSVLQPDGMQRIFSKDIAELLGIRTDGVARKVVDGAIRHVGVDGTITDVRIVSTSRTLEFNVGDYEKVRERINYEKHAFKTITQLRETLAIAGIDVGVSTIIEMFNPVRAACSLDGSRSFLLKDGTSQTVRLRTAVIGSSKTSRYMTRDDAVIFCRWMEENFVRTHRPKTQPDVPEGIMTTQQAAEALGIADTTILLWMSNGRIRGTQIGRTFYFAQEEIERVKQEMPVHPQGAVRLSELLGELFPEHDVPLAGARKTEGGVVFFTMQDENGEMVSFKLHEDIHHAYFVGKEDAARIKEIQHSIVCMKELAGKVGGAYHTIKQKVGVDGMLVLLPGGENFVFRSHMRGSSRYFLRSELDEFLEKKKQARKTDIPKSKRMYRKAFLLLPGITENVLRFFDDEGCIRFTHNGTERMIRWRNSSFSVEKYISKEEAHALQRYYTIISRQSSEYVSLQTKGRGVLATCPVSDYKLVLCGYPQVLVPFEEINGRRYILKEYEELVDFYIALSTGDNEEKERAIARAEFHLQNDSVRFRLEKTRLLGHMLHPEDPPLPVSRIRPGEIRTTVEIQEQKRATPTSGICIAETVETTIDDIEAFVRTHATEHGTVALVAPAPGLQRFLQENGLTPSSPDFHVLQRAYPFMFDYCAIEVSLRNGEVISAHFEVFTYYMGLFRQPFEKAKKLAISFISQRVIDADELNLAKLWLTRYFYTITDFKDNAEDEGLFNTLFQKHEGLFFVPIPREYSVFRAGSPSATVKEHEQWLEAFSNGGMTRTFGFTLPD